MQGQRLRKREIIVGFIAVVAIAVLVFFRKELTAQFDVSAGYDQAAPHLAEFQNAVANADDVALELQKIWSVNRLPHRRFVLAYLREQVGASTLPESVIRPILVEGTTGPDADGVTDALERLQTLSEGEALMYAPSMLGDPDPRVRDNWISYVATVGSDRHAALVVPLLADPDPAVSTRAAAALRSWTDQLVDIRAGDDEQQRQRGRERFLRWWSEHKADFPSPESVAATPPPPSTVRGYSFALPGIRGRDVSVDLESGVPTAILFFSTRVPDALKMVQAMARVERELGVQARIVLICTDAVEGTYIYDPRRREIVRPMEAELPVGMAIGPEATGQPMAHDEVAAALERLAAEQRIDSPIGIEDEGVVARAYAAMGQPTTILLDASGFVRRRFSGARSADTVIAMLRHIDPTIAPATTPPAPDDPLKPLDPLDDIAPLDDATPAPLPPRE